MKFRSAFTMIELIFVIIIMGILAKFGVEFLARAYENFIYSSTNNTLQAKTASAVEFVANRLQYRIKDSVIVRQSLGGNLEPLSNALAGTDYVVLEWISEDIDGYRGLNAPLWSGIIDVDAGGGNILVSPATNTQEINTLIKTLSNGGSDINDSALYYVGANTIPDTFGWDAAITDQNQSMHPIQSDGTANLFYASTTSPMIITNFNGTRIYEYYKLAWTAYAVTVENDDLYFYYDYQPWQGDKFSDGKKSILMENVSTFQAIALGSIIKIQVCAKSDIILGKNDGSEVGGYSLCKEKTVY